MYHWYEELGEVPSFCNLRNLFVKAPVREGEKIRSQRECVIERRRFNLARRRDNDECFRLFPVHMIEESRQEDSI